MATEQELSPTSRVDSTPEKEMSAEPSSLGQQVRGWVRDISLTALTAILIVIFVVQPVKVEGTSMEPRFEAQDRILVNKFVYYFSEVERGDIVVFWYPKDQTKSFIKRAIGLPGETVEMRSGVVYLNGEELSEPYLPTESDYRSFPLQVVPPDHYFVLGDHRTSSNDSRDWGFVPGQNIFGEAVFRYWPLSKLGLIR